ncbi:hypothetical protein [Streptomyces tendae]|uniref:hypothetical protein n=1 Tax=Streptomyces tendae TaxID=1932 RepID=UPI003D7430EB
MIIARVVQTCFACPSQWDAWTIDGDYLYLRYRWGVGTIDDEHGTNITRFTISDPYGGVIGLDEFARRTGLVILNGADSA